jgi:hypothetical protein
MEYMAYQEWLLKKVCAKYQITPKEIGVERPAPQLRD